MMVRLPHRHGLNPYAAKAFCIHRRTANTQPARCR
jgi:hypothetical protein